jgi:membrane protein YqaA with SNARE-associated domain
LADSVSTSDATATKRPHLLKRIYNWVLHWADTPYGTPALFLISFAESSFFPIPPDVLQIALSVARPKRSFFYAAVNALGSVLGGMMGWLIGYAFWATVSSYFFDYVPGFSHKNFDFVQDKYQSNAFLAIFSAAFTPIPYKVFTIAAGVFNVSFGVLVLASALGRSCRFFAVATCIYLFGPQVKSLIDKYFELATILFMVLLIGGFVVIKFALHD